MSGLTFDTPHFQAIVEILVPVTATAGDSLCFDLSVSPFAGDEEPFDNEHLDQCFEVRNAYDPNDKGVWPQGVCAEHWVQMGTPLNYTIRFQNTGTADAVNVFLLDTLDADLDITTVVVKAHSHLMYTEVLPGNVLRFAFDNIYLPDSTTDEPASHGYLVYEVQPLSLVSAGTQIHNGAAIHFDFNAPVLTNVVMNTYTDSVPPCIPASLNELEEGLSLFPNPSSGNVTLSTQDRISSVSVWNLMGQKLEVEQVWQSPNEITLSLAGHPAGLYLIRAETAGKVLTRRIWIE